jgi:response regulator RpfG family c-di-GMP phosphodiesterase
MNESILLVDDDARVVSAMQRTLHRHYSIEIAAGAQDALDAIHQHGYAVVVSDLQMPEMNGVELLAKVREVSPETVRILLTGHADLDAAISAVNEGSIFRFLTKPCPQDLLQKTLDAALEQHRLQVAEREVLQETLTGTVAILVEILSAIQPLAFGRAARIRRNVRLLARELNLGDSWEFEAAAMLSQIGCISVDPRILERHYAGAELSESDRTHLLSQASIGRKLLHRVPRLQAVSQMIERQYQDWSDLPKEEGEPRLIAMGAQLLRAASEFDRLVGAGRSSQEALDAMQRDHTQYAPELLPALSRIQEELLRAGGETGDYHGPSAEQLIFRPIAEEVLRSLRN